jgi:hypothetical protein
MAWCLRCGEYSPWWTFWRKHSCSMAEGIISEQLRPKFRQRMKVSELEKITDPCGEDSILISDMSAKESKQISLAQIKAFIKS